MRIRLALLAPLATLVLSCKDSTGPKDEEIISVVSGNGFSCALLGEAAYCWGRNDVGQLGRGAAGPDAGPGPVGGDHHFKLIAASERTACAVDTDNKVFCWGHGRIFGQTAPMPLPEMIHGSFPTTIAAIGVGYSHGCVLGQTGAAVCFGTNSLGELGNGTIEPATGVLGATAVTGGHAFTQLSVGALHTCGLQAGDVWCWGTNFTFSFGPGTTEGTTYPTPRQVTLTFKASRVDAGSAFMCVLDAVSKAWCWGNNLTGQLGRGAGASPSASPEVVAVTEVAAFTSLAMPRLNSTIAHMCGIASSGAFCWGLNDSTQLGRTTTEICATGSTSRACSHTPGQVTSQLGFKLLAVGRDHTCGLAGEPSAVYCWGADGRKQLGGTVGVNSATAVKITLK